MEIKKILKRPDGTKYVIIPKDANLEVGDYVSINKINQDQGGHKSEE